MLIDLCRFSPLTIDPFQYPTTVVIRITAPDDKPFCGVFAGRHQNFSREEEGKMVHMMKTEDEIFDDKNFILDRTDKCERDYMMRRWVYSAIGWTGGIYADLPYSYEITLQECKNTPEENTWSLSITRGGEHSPIVLILNDYQPGALAREVQQYPN